MPKPKTLCNNCNQLRNSNVRYKNKVICRRCYLNKTSMVFRGPYTLSEALDKVYEVELIREKYRNTCRILNLPIILADEKVKFKLINGRNSKANKTRKVYDKHLQKR